jgi:nucleotide-binding universal stress UspA family protein
MTLTILVPLDGSPLAARALPFAASLVEGGRGRLVLAHVQSSLYTDIPSYYDPATEVDALREAGVTATSLVYRAPTEEIADVLDLAIRESTADLVVMSTHGRGGLGRTIFGSVADQLMRRAEVPVLLVPPACEVSWQTRHPAQILVSLDGSPLAEQALASATALARLLNAEILLVRALSPAIHARYRGDKLTLSSADFVEVEDAWRYLSEVSEGLRAGGCRVSFWVLVGSPSASIADAARTEDVDLIVMTTHGRGGLSRLLLGSTADSILQRSHVPILLLRSGVASRSAIATATSTENETATQADGFAASMAARQ